MTYTIRPDLTVQDLAEVVLELANESTRLKRQLQAMEDRIKALEDENSDLRKELRNAKRCWLFRIYC